MKKIKVGLLIPSLRGGGAERVVSNLSLLLPEKYRVYIIVHSAEINYPYRGVLLDLKEGHRRNISGKAKVLLMRIIKLRKIKKKYGLDVVISFMEGPNFVNILSGGRSKTVISVRNNITDSYRDFYGRIYRILLRFLYPRVDSIVVLTGLLREQLELEYGIDKSLIEIIPNPVNIEKIEKKKEEELPAEYRDIFKKPVIINMGRLEIQKGQDLLLQAFKLVKREVKDAVLVIIGMGEREKELKELAYSLDIADSVFFTGFEKNPFKFLGRARVFVFSSHYEGFANALVEAMACALPVVTFDCKSGPREILAPETDFRMEAEGIKYTGSGILVQPGNIEKLAEATINILKNRELQQRYGEKAEKRARDFSPGRVIEKWCKLLESK